MKNLETQFSKHILRLFKKNGLSMNHYHYHCFTECLYIYLLLLRSIAKVVHAMRGRGHRNDLSGLMLSLGAGPQDKKLLDAWSMGLPSNPA